MFMRRYKLAADRLGVSVQEHLKSLGATEEQISKMMRFAPTQKADAPTTRQEIVEPGGSQGKGPEIPRSQAFVEGPELKPHKTALRIEAEAIAAGQLDKEGFGENIAKYEVEKGMMADQNEKGLAI